MNAPLRASSPPSSLAASPGRACAQPDEAVLARAKGARRSRSSTRRSDLVAIESGSRDKEGLDQLADLVAARLKALGRGGRARGGGRRLPHGGHARADRPGGARHLQGQGHEEDPPDRPHGHRLPQGHGRAAALPHRRRPRLRPGHRRRQAGHRDDPAHGRHPEGHRLRRVRHAHRAGERRRGDQLAGPPGPHHAPGRRARRHDVLRGRARQRGQALARDGGHRLA